MNLVHGSPQIPQDINVSNEADFRLKRSRSFPLSLSSVEPLFNIIPARDITGVFAQRRRECERACACARQMFLTPNADSR